MNASPSHAVRLFGTDEPTVPPRLLRAGALTAEFDAGNLRHIRAGGVEIIRAVSFIVRDRNWGTYNPRIENLSIEERADGFAVAYEALAGDGAQAFRYRARIEADVGGRLDFSAEGEGETDFLTNRTGFVVLHPIVGVAGRPVTIEHADGSIEEGRFPDLIDPVQPMMAIRALTHEAAPGIMVACRMEGDTYEMEDQRNWTDASYKTYVRPLALPWPYTIGQGERIEQAVRLRVSGLGGGASSSAPDDGATAVSIGPAIGRVPRIGLGLDPDEVSDTLAHAAPLRALGAQVVIGHHDPRRGHDRTTLEGIAKTAEAIGAEAWLEAVVVSVEDFAEEVAALGETVAAIGSPFRSVLLSPASDLKSTLPGSVWPPAPPAPALVEAARAAFPTARIGGGMISYFTEFNRKRPPVDAVDFVSFTTAATVHAGDDVSVAEGLEALPAIALSARHIAGDKPLCVGPSAIGMRMNPYGEAPVDNPGNGRQAMTYNDPRQRGLLGAAWTLGHVARFAQGGAETVTLGGTTGAFGLLSVPQPWPQPFYEGRGRLFPAYHVLRGLAQLAGRPLLAVEASPFVEALAAETEEGAELWLANRTGQVRAVTLPRPARDLFLLDAESFEAAAADPEASDHSTRPQTETSIELPPYAVARLRFS